MSLDIIPCLKNICFMPQRGQFFKFGVLTKGLKTFFGCLFISQKAKEVKNEK